MGLSNMACSRLSQSWDKLPSKFRKLFAEFEALIDPSRNHRAYRLVVSKCLTRNYWHHIMSSHYVISCYICRVFVGKLQPPVVPFMPLLLKDMTFAHEGNKTSLDGLVNFEKMHMMAQTMRTIRFCRSRHLGEYFLFFVGFFLYFSDYLHPKVQSSNLKIISLLSKATINRNDFNFMNKYFLPSPIHQ